MIEQVFTTSLLFQSTLNKGGVTALVLHRNRRIGVLPGKCYLRTIRMHNTPSCL